MGNTGTRRKVDTPGRGGGEKNTLLTFLFYACKFAQGACFFEKGFDHRAALGSGTRVFSCLNQEYTRPAAVGTLLFASLPFPLCSLFINSSCELLLVF